MIECIRRAWYSDLYAHLDAQMGAKMWKLWGLTIYLTILSIYDIRERKIPVSLLLSGGTVVAVYVVYGLLSGGNSLDKFLIALIPGIILLAAAVLTGKVGSADGLLLMMVGPVMGFRQCASVFCISLFLTAIVSAVLLVLHRVDCSTELPYVPFLAVTVLFYGICA